MAHCRRAQHHVVRVVDGDTLLVDPHARVRLIGVNAPETVKPDWPVEPWGPEASAFTKQFVSGGTVRLEFDDEPLDAYDRYLAYVWVDDRMLNEALLRAGLARFEPDFHYSSAMKRRFRQAQDEARRKHLGIWSGHDAAMMAPPRAMVPLPASPCPTDRNSSVRQRLAALLNPSRRW